MLTKGIMRENKFDKFDKFIFIISKRSQTHEENTCRIKKMR